MPAGNTFIRNSNEVKKLKKSLKVIALILSALILFQSCATYKTPVTLKQAAQEEKAVKIITVDDDTYKYKYIVFEDGQFFGVKDNPGEDVKFPINADEVYEVFEKKGRFPTWAIIVIAGGVLLGVIAIIASSSVSPNPW